MAIGKKDYAGAKTHADEYRQGAEASKNPAQVKLAHELAGRIALAQKDYDAASRNWSRPTSRIPATFIAWARPIKAKVIRRSAQKFSRRLPDSIRCRR